MVECRYTLGDEEKSIFVVAPPAVLQIPIIEPLDCTWRPAASWGGPRPMQRSYVPYTIFKDVVYYAPLVVS